MCATRCTSIFAAISGQAPVFASWSLFAYAVAMLLIQAGFVKLHEEPIPRRKFDRAHSEYCAAVPGWLPRATAWHGSAHEG